MITMTARRLAAAAALGLASATALGAAPAEPADRPPSITETLTAVRQISHELKRIEERLGALEQSVARVDASLRPVGALAQPDGLRNLLLLATACGAGLIILHAALRRWFVPASGR
jgi:hypothetical protein